MDWTAIITALVTAGIPAVVTLVTSNKAKKMSKMHSAKQSILQMQMEDVVAVEILHKLPCNYTNIHYEYDIYHKNGGNSDIDKKMAEYEEWYKNLNNKVNKKTHDKKIEPRKK